MTGLTARFPPSESSFGLDLSGFVSDQSVDTIYFFGLCDFVRQCSCLSLTSEDDLYWEQQVSVLGVARTSLELVVFALTSLWSGGHRKASHSPPVPVQPVHLWIRSASSALL